MNPNPETLPRPQPASLWSRSLAYLLDCTLLASLAWLIIVNIILAWLYPGFTYDFMELAKAQEALIANGDYEELFQLHAAFQMKHDEALFTVQFVLIMMIWLYFALNEGLLEGATFGKKILKLQVIDTLTLQKPKPRAIFIRNFVKTMTTPIVFPLLSLSFLLPLFNRRRQAGHDMLSKTQVVRDFDLILKKESDLLPEN